MLITQIVQYKNSSLQIRDIIIDGLSMSHDPLKVISNNDTRILWNGPKNWLLISKNKNLNENIKYCSKLIFSDKPILIEKPLHNNYRKLNKILKDPRAKLNNKVLAYNRRHYSVVDKLKKR